MNLRHFWHKKQQFRLVLCGHKVFEVSAVCLLLMVQGHLGMVRPAHLAIATETGLLAVFPVLGITFTRYARYFANCWVSSSLLGICAFLADALIHRSHYGGEYTEAALTGLGAFALSVAISYTPLGKKIDGLADSFLHRRPAAATVEQRA
jgi:hypothetical protein